MFARFPVLLGVLFLQVNGWSPDKDDFTDMKQGEAFSAKVLQSGNGWIDVILKQGELISSMTLFGTSGEGLLRYNVLSGCRPGYQDCHAFKDETKAEQKLDFPSGELVLAVEWRPSEVAVWQLGDPQHVATMPVNATTDGRGRLRVRVALAPIPGLKTEFAVLQRDGQTSSPNQGTSSPSTTPGS